MKKYWKYEVFPLFLDFIKDCTFASLEDTDLIAILENITKLSVEEFLFPKMALTYSYDPAIDPGDELPFGYYWDNNVGQAELRVLFSIMKVYWVEMQLHNKQNFLNPFYDSDIKGYSPANMLKTITEVYVVAQTTARKAAFSYSRRDKDGRPSLGDIHDS